MLKRNLLILLSPVLLSYMGCGPSVAPLKQEESSYFGSSAQEYTIDFKSDILVSASQGEPSEESIQADVRLAAKHTLGRMHNDGALYPAMKIKMLKSEIDTQNADYYRVQYSFSGKAVLAKNLKDYTLFVPLMPQKIYARSSGKCHHKSEDKVDDENFWYQWDPDVPGCPLKEKKDYSKIKIALIPVVVPAKTYPEYQRLIQNGVVNATIFIGANGKNNKEWNPETTQDRAGLSYIQMKRFLESELHFTMTPITEAEVRKIYNPKNGSLLPQGHVGTLQTSKALIRVRLLFVESDFNSSRAEGFHYLLRDSLKKDSIMIYDGHSGIGANLNIDKIEKAEGFKMALNPNYQIIFFGSCLPYAYYTQMYFDHKANGADPKGTKNLDLLVYGKESGISNTETHQVMRVLIGGFTSGTLFPYQDMVYPTAKDFFGVVGDEDNPTAAKYF